MALRFMPNARSRSRGFTLIEILVVVAILVILMGLAVAIGANVQSKAKIGTTKRTLTTLQGVLEQYVAATGGSAPAIGTSNFVPAFAGLPETQHAIASLKQYINPNNSSQINDAFGNPIQLVAPPTAAKLGFQSAGPDGIYNTPTTPSADDIYSWDPN